MARGTRASIADGPSVAGACCASISTYSVAPGTDSAVLVAAEAKFASSFKSSGRADHEVLVDLSQSMSRSPWGASPILFGAWTFILCICVFVAAWDDVSV